MQQQKSKLVEQILDLEEDRNRFYREHGQNKWYRDQLRKIIDLKIGRLVLEEEEADINDYPKLVAERKALREVKGILSLLENGGKYAETHRRKKD